MTFSSVAAPIVAACLSILTLVPGAAFGQQVTPDDRDRIDARIGQLSDHVSSGDIGATLDIIPPRLKAVLLDETGIVETDLKREMNQVWANLLSEEGLTLVDFNLALDEAAERVTPTGHRAYLTIPTETRLEIEDTGSFRILTQTLAMEDEGDWYLIRMDKPEQTELLARAYPEFEGVAFPASEIVVDQYQADEEPAPSPTPATGVSGP